MSRQDDLDCMEFVEHLSGLVDDTLDERTRRRVDAHLAACDGCTVYLDQFKATIEALGHLPVQEVTELPEPARRALLAAFREGRMA